MSLFLSLSITYIVYSYPLTRSPIERIGDNILGRTHSNVQVVCGGWIEELAPQTYTALVVRHLKNPGYILYIYIHIYFVCKTHGHTH